MTKQRLLGQADTPVLALSRNCIPGCLDCILVWCGYDHSIRGGPQHLWEMILEKCLVELPEGTWYTRMALWWLKTKDTRTDEEEAEILRRSGFKGYGRLRQRWIKCYRHFLNKAAKQIILKALGRRYDIVTAVIHGCHKANEMSDGMAPKGEDGDWIINALITEANNVCVEATEYLQQQVGIYPEIISAVETGHAVRQLMTNIHTMIEESNKEGFIDEEDAERFTHKVRHTMDQLRRYPPFPRKAKAKGILREITWLSHVSPEAFDEFRGRLEFEQGATKGTLVSQSIERKISKKKPGDEAIAIARGLCRHGQRRRPGR